MTQQGVQSLDVAHAICLEFDTNSQETDDSPHESSL